MIKELIQGTYTITLLSQEHFALIYFMDLRLPPFYTDVFDLYLGTVSMTCLKHIFYFYQSF